MLLDDECRTNFPWRRLMQARRHTPRRTQRRGFTLIELLVVISIIATLMALLLPAIQNAREAARRTQCLNNQRNLATAMIGWATAHNNQLPAYGYWKADNADPTMATIQPQRSWVVELLPYMDQQGAYDRWGTAVGDTLATNDASADFAGGFSFAVLVCPDDETAVDTAGGLSYVVNAGYGADVGTGDTATAPAGGATPDAPGDGTDHGPEEEDILWDDVAGISAFDLTINKATTVFAPEHDVLEPAMSPTAIVTHRNESANLGRIYDGTSNTIMLTENIQAGVDIVNPGLNNSWASPEHRNATFIVPVLATMGSPSLDYNTGGFTAVGTPFINDTRVGVDGENPFPNSNHPGIVVATFCDGTVRTLNESIDQSVYLRLVTPGGTRQRSGFTVEAPLSDTDY